MRRSVENFDRLAAAMRELNARLRVEGLSDEEAAALPVQLDGLTLSRSQISTWATDAGYLDVLIDMVNRQGHRKRFEDLEGAAEELTVAGVQVCGRSLILAFRDQRKSRSSRTCCALLG
ncbi:MAG: hypothetical protein ACYCVN_10025 [Acidimicrobiales bacterium]